MPTKEEAKIKYQEGFFKGIQDANIYHQSWLPEGEVKAVLIIVVMVSRTAHESM